MAHKEELTQPGVRVIFSFRPDMVIDPELLAELQADLPGTTFQLEVGWLTAYTSRTESSPVAVIRKVIGCLEPIDLKVQEAPIEEVVYRGIGLGHRRCCMHSSRWPWPCQTW